MASYLKSSQHEQTIKEWLAEFKSLPESSLKKYAAGVSEKTEVISAFKIIVSNISNAATLNLVQSSCHQLFDFYCCGNQDLRTYTLAFLPAMINGYLLSCYSRNELAAESKASFETYLLAIYNLMCGERSETETMGMCMEIPNLTKPSIYHDPMTYPFSEHTITTSNTESTYIELPIAVTYASILPSNRCKILNTILMSYCDQISTVSKTSLGQLCVICEQLATRGFPWHSDYAAVDKGIRNRRIQLDTSLMITLVRCVYFALYNHCKAKGVKALEAVLKRAEYELNTQVLLLCNAVLNSVYQEGDTTSSDDPLGVSAALTPLLVRSNSGISRLAVTASSIRHHRWRHKSEEVSGDVTESLHQESIAPNTKTSSKMPQSQEGEEPVSKADKQSSISPSKLLKTKMKKNVQVPSPSTGERGQKTANANEKKGKKWLQTISSFEDDNPEQPRVRTPSGNSGEGTSTTNPFSSASLPSLKQLSMDEPNTDETAKLSTSKSSDANNRNGVVESPPTTHKKGKSDKAKHKAKLNPETEMKELLSGLRRSGSKKHKEMKTSQGHAAVPLLNPTEMENEENVSTEF